MDSAIKVLFEWQTLIGAIIGGFLSLVVALVVARAQEARERRAAASVVDIDLLVFWAAAESLNRRFPDTETNPEHIRLWAVRVLRNPPQLSPLFDGEMARLLGIDVALEHHLAYFRQDVRAFDIIRRRLTETDLVERMGPGLVAVIAPDAYDLVASLRGAAWHGQKADVLVRSLVFSSFRGTRRFHRLIMRHAKREIATISQRLVERARNRANWTERYFPEQTSA